MGANRVKEYFTWFKQITNKYKTISQAFLKLNQVNQVTLYLRYLEHENGKNIREGNIVLNKNLPGLPGSLLGY